jgi:hypothetical protein
VAKRETGYVDGTALGAAGLARPSHPTTQREATFEGSKRYIVMKFLRVATTAWLFMFCAATELCAQDGLSDGPYPNSHLTQIGSATEDRLRLRQILGDTTTQGFLFRTPSTLHQHRDPNFRLTVIQPSLESIWNSRLPFSLNTGPLWGSRGLNIQMTSGVTLTYGALQVILAPQFVYSENRDFQTLSPDDTTRSQFSSPWYIRGQSADLPLRFGNSPSAAILPGQSSLTLHLRGVRLGAATENEWWGPAVRNAIVMSNHSDGIPRIFV